MIATPIPRTTGAIITTIATVSAPTTAMTIATIRVVTIRVTMGTVTMAMTESDRDIAAERRPIRDISTIRDMATRGTATATVMAPGMPHHPRTTKPD